MFDTLNADWITGPGTIREDIMPDLETFSKKVYSYYKYIVDAEATLDKVAGNY